MYLNKQIINWRWFNFKNIVMPPVNWYLMEDNRQHSQLIINFSDYYFISGNVGLNKPTTIPDNSQHENYLKLNEGYPAVDGDVNQISQQAPYSCSVMYIKSPWWRVDLGGSHRVYSVSYISCTDVCGEFLFKIRVFCLWLSYSPAKQILPFGFARQYTTVQCVSVLCQLYEIQRVWK